MTYFYPNRPTLLPPDKQYINSLEATGLWIAEKKFNGDNILINTNQPTKILNRYGQPLARYSPSEEVLQELSQWPKNMLINAELMNNHTKNMKNILIVHCIMIHHNKPLIGKTWNDSRKILNQMPNNLHVQISEIFTSGFWNLFQETDGTTIEGIILKRLSGKLVFSSTPPRDVPWMLKIRKPCKKYPF
jgi:hypothetical protein